MRMIGVFQESKNGFFGNNYIHTRQNFHPIRNVHYALWQLVHYQSWVWRYLVRVRFKMYPTPYISKCNIFTLALQTYSKSIEVYPAPLCMSMSTILFTLVPSTLYVHPNVSKCPSSSSHSFQARSMSIEMFPNVHHPLHTRSPKLPTSKCPSSSSLQTYPAPLCLCLALLLGWILTFHFLR